MVRGSASVRPGQQDVGFQQSCRGFACSRGPRRVVVLGSMSAVSRHFVQYERSMGRRRQDGREASLERIVTATTAGSDERTTMAEPAPALGPAEEPGRLVTPLLGVAGESVGPSSSALRGSESNVTLSRLPRRRPHRRAAPRPLGRARVAGELACAFAHQRELAGADEPRACPLLGARRGGVVGAVVAVVDDDAFVVAIVGPRDGALAYHPKRMMWVRPDRGIVRSRRLPRVHTQHRGTG